MGAHVQWLVHQRAVVPHAVARHVGAHVEVVAQFRQGGAAHVGHRQQRARLGVALAKTQKIVGQRGRQDGQVGLNKAGSQASRGARQTAIARLLAHGKRVVQRRGQCVGCHHGFLSPCGCGRLMRHAFKSISAQKGRAVQFHVRMEGDQNFESVTASSATCTASRATAAAKWLSRPRSQEAVNDSSGKGAPRTSSRRS